MAFTIVAATDPLSPGIQRNQPRFAMLPVPFARLGAGFWTVLLLTFILVFIWFGTRLVAGHQRATLSAGMVDDWAARLSRGMPSAEAFRRRCREEAESLGADERAALAAAARTKAIGAIKQVAAIDGPLPEVLLDQVTVRLDLGGCFFPDLLEQACILYAEQAHRLGRSMSETEIRECLARLGEALAAAESGPFRDRLIREREQLVEEYGAIGGCLTGVIP